MSSSRARYRFAALAGAVPLVVGVLVAPAFAAGGITVVSVPVDGQTLGPHAGYLGAGIGQNGTTEIFRITVPSTGTTISSVHVTLVGTSTQIALGRDFDPGDGFALYKNVDNISGLSAVDKQQGLVSTGWSQESSEPDGDTPIRIELPGPVSGKTEYYVTAHPKAQDWTLRQFTLRMEPDGVTGSDSGPANAVSTPTTQRLRIDSQAPAAPAKRFFTPNSRIAGLEDSYSVQREAATEPDLLVAFYNSTSDTAETAVLVRPNSALAVDTVLPDSPTAQSHEILIGDGTGLTPTTLVARNNQKTNNVYARLIDSAGNFSTSATPLLVTYPSGDADPTARGNIVSGPAKPTSVTIASPNSTNVTAVPVNVKAAGNPAAPSDTVSLATTMTGRLVQLGSDGKPDLSTVWTATETMPFGSAASGVNINVNANPVTGPPAFPGIAEGAAAVGFAMDVDALGNQSDVVISPPKFRDTVVPVLSIVDSPHTGTAIPGDLVTLQFSEPMAPASIVASPVASGSGTSERCEPVAPSRVPPANSIQDRMPIQTTGGAKRVWGYNACFKWGAGNTSATVRVGDAYATGTVCDSNPMTPTPPDCDLLFSTGDRVLPATGMTDVAGNPVHGLNASPGAVGSTVIGSLTPQAVAAVTNDLNEDGVLESIDVTFTAPIDNSGFATYAPNLSVVGNAATVPVTAVTYPTGSHATVRFSFGGGFGTGEVPVVTLVRPSAGGSTGLYTQEGSPREVLPFSIQAVDHAAPRPMSVVYSDSNPRDGHIDSTVVTYSEPINHARDNNGTSPLAVGGYRVNGYEDVPASPQTPNHNSVKETGAVFGPVKTINLKTSASFDTGVPSLSMSFTPETAASPSCTTSPCTQIDAAGEEADHNGDSGPGTGYARTVLDGAAPFIRSRTTRDLDNDGKIDAVDVLFSEPLSSPSLGTAKFTVAGHVVSDQFGIGGGDTIRLVIDELGDPGTGDTDAKPAVSYSGGVADTQGNVTPADGATPPATVDGAGPAIVAACATSPAPDNGICPAGNDGTKLLVVFSEPLSAAAAKTKFVVEQPLGTVKDQNAEPTMSPAVPASGSTPAVAANKSATLSFAAGATAIDATQNAYVRFAADAAVTDVALNPSHQVSMVTAFPVPSVSLDLSCPTPASPGYCTSTTIGTGAAGTPGITRWRLMETARGTAPPASEFTTSPAATLTLPEGTHTLYLSGKDAYGRLSPEVSRSVTIYLPPTIVSSSVKFVDLASSAPGSWSKAGTSPVLVDGDNFRVEADGYGTDASSWKSSNGNCLAAYMSVDYRSTTHNATNGVVAPFSCDLFTNSAPPHRHMSFPIVKASGTTHYPVGTVLRTSSADPGSMIVDGPNGTQLRRQFISVNARRSWRITDASVITVPSAVISGVTRTTNLGYRDGALMHTSGSGAYYYALNGERHFVSQSTLGYWRMPLSSAYTVTSGELSLMPTKSGFGPGAHPAGTWIKFSSGSIQQIVRNGQGVLVRRELAASQALTTLVGGTQVYAANSKDAALPLDTFKRGYRDGTLLKFSDGTYGVVARGVLRRFANPATFNTLGFNASNAITPNGAAISHVTGQSYLTGAPIDRYKITSLVISVRNTAGGSASAIVLPALGGIYGAGTLDPVPADWDFTRS
jgi:hypothetical protein